MYNYKIGDKVKLVNKGWAGGREAVIVGLTDIHWADRTEGGYILDIDNGRFIWEESDFVDELKEVNIDEILMTN